MAITSALEAALYRLRRGQNWCATTGPSYRTFKKLVALGLATEPKDGVFAITEAGQAALKLREL